MSVAGYQAKLAEANKTYRALFFQALEFEMAKADALASALAMVVQSSGSSEKYNFSDAVPPMKEWLDERPISRLAVQNFEVINRRYANGVEVDSDDLADDKLGLLAPRIQNLAKAAAAHKLSLFRILMNTAFTTGLAYDGVSFFNASHPRSSGGVQDNLQTGALDSPNYQAATTKLEVITDEEGEFLESEVTHLIVGPENRYTALELVENERDSSGATNVTRGSAEVIVMKGLTSGYWFVADLSKPIKPFVWQDRDPVRFDAQDNPADEERFMRNKARWGATYRGAAGLAMWQLMVGSVG